MGHLGFSYIGLIFLLMLFIPNILWGIYKKVVIKRKTSKVF